jgi:sugar phosphate permease
MQVNEQNPSTPEQAGKSPRIRSLQRGALVLLFISGSISTIDRAALAVANPLIRHDMNLSVSEMGFLLSAFLWAYAFAQLPVGWLIDRFGPRSALGVGLALWSAAQAMCGFVSNSFQFTLARIGLGIGEAPQFPTAARVVRDWFPKRERGKPTGIFAAASYFGTGIAAPLITVLMLQFGWRAMFAILGVAGLLTSLVWFAKYRDPGKAQLNDAEHHYRTDGQRDQAQPRVSFRQWSKLFRSSTTWGIVGGNFGVQYVTWLFNSWLPAYLQMSRHMTLAKVGFAAAIPYVFAVGGTLCAGFVADYLAKGRLGLVNGRKVAICSFLIGQATAVIVAAYATSDFSALAFVSLAMFCGTATSTTSWSSISILAPEGFTGSLGALQNFGGYIGAALAPIVTGIIVEQSGSFLPALLTGAGVSGVSAVIYLVMLRGPIVLSRDEAALDGGRVFGERTAE